MIRKRLLLVEEFCRLVGVIPKAAKMPTRTMLIKKVPRSVTAISSSRSSQPHGARRSSGYCWKMGGGASGWTITGDVVAVVCSSGFDNPAAGGTGGSRNDSGRLGLLSSGIIQVRQSRLHRLARLHSG